MIRKRLLFVIVMIGLLWSCSPVRRQTGTVILTPVNQFAADYINAYSEIAVSEMRRTGVPASIKLAQGMLESDFGRSRLAVKANNHFGIKCHSTWKGPKIYHDDDAKGECFRKYSRVEDSFRDHSDFLTSTQRYQSLFQLRSDDYKGWAHGLKKAGYATNPNYAHLLIRSIEENQLYLLDRGTVKVTQPRSSGGRTTNTSNTPVASTRQGTGSSIGAIHSRIQEKNRVQYVIFRSNDSFQSMVVEFDLLRWELDKYNDFPDGYVPKEGDIIYLQPKRKRAEVGYDHHIVKEGESLFYVSQIYGVKLSSILKYNGLKKGDEVAAGTRLWLRFVRPDLE